VAILLDAKIAVPKELVCVETWTINVPEEVIPEVYEIVPWIMAANELEHAAIPKITIKNDDLSSFLNINQPPKDYFLIKKITRDIISPG
jgi:hypothetical protein